MGVGEFKEEEVAEFKEGVVAEFKEVELVECRVDGMIIEGEGT